MKLNTIVDRLQFTTPLPLEAHAIAQEFCQQQAQQEKAKQIYLNTLAVYAVNFYLEVLGIETNLTESDSWHPVMQTLGDVADVEVVGKGKLECRPVLPNSEVCHVPPEVWSERIGYIPVQFDAELTQAQLMGFLPTVSATEVPLSQFESLENLLTLLEEASPLVHLGQWFENIIEPNWHKLESLLTPQQLESAFAFRTRPHHHSRERARVIPLEPITEEVILAIAPFSPSPSQTQIFVTLFPSQNQLYLPSNLELSILDETGQSVMQAQTRAENKQLQFDFAGEPGETFGVKIVLDQTTFIQRFII